MPTVKDTLERALARSYLSPQERRDHSYLLSLIEGQSHDGLTIAHVCHVAAKRFDDDAEQMRQRAEWCDSPAAAEAAAQAKAEGAILMVGPWSAGFMRSMAETFKSYAGAARRMEVFLRAEGTLADVEEEVTCIRKHLEETR